jgi:hypothetical protein
MRTQSQESSYLQEPELAAFRKRGYIVVKDLLGEEEVDQLRSLVSETFAEMVQDGRVGVDPGREGTIRGLDSDLLSIPSLRHMLLDPRILRIIGELLGGEPVYFGDSSVRIGGNGVRAWHRDNVNRTRRRGPDWDDSYRLVRCGLYLQDHSRHSGGLALRPYSHKTKRLLPTLPTLANSEAGNLVAWNMRIVHSGEVVRLRSLPGVPLNPRVQSRLPNFMRVPEDRERIVLFMAFGLSGSHLDNYVEYLRTRHYMQKSWSRSRFGPEGWEEAKNAGLRVLRPTPTYGTSPEYSHSGSKSPTEHHERAVLPHARAEQSRVPDRSPQPLDEQGSPEESEAEQLAVQMLAAVKQHPRVAAIAHTGYSLVEFAEPRLRSEILELMRGWTHARLTTTAQEPVCDPAMAPALHMGIRAGLGLDPTVMLPAIHPKTPDSPIRRVAVRQAMRGVAAVSDPERVRVATVATGRLSLALASLSTTDLRAAGVGVLPFPGLENGDGMRLALRRRVPLLTGYGPRRPGSGVAVSLPARLDLGCEPELDRALTLLVEWLLSGVAAQQDRAVRALGGLTRTHALRTILLPDMNHGASRLLAAYAQDRGLRIRTHQQLDATSLAKTLAALGS